MVCGLLTGGLRENAYVSKWQIALLACRRFLLRKNTKFRHVLVCLFQNGKIYYRISYERWR